MGVYYTILYTDGVCVCVCVCHCIEMFLVLSFGLQY